MDRFLLWLIGKIGLSTLVSLSLLIGGMSTAAFGLEKLVPDIDQGFLWPAILVSTLAGWILGRSRMAGWKAAIAGALLVIGANLFHFGNLSGPLLIWLARLEELVVGMLRWPLAGQPDPVPFLRAAESLWASLNALLLRVLAWLGSLPAGSESRDPLPVALLWSMAIWGFSLWASWVVGRRASALQAFVPAVVLLAAVLNYKRENPFSLAILLGFALLLMLATSHRRRQHGWIEQGIDFSNELELDLALIAGPLVMVIILTAVAIPSIPIKGIVTAVQRLAQPRSEQIREVGESLGLGKPGSQPFVVGGLSISPGLPRSHLLGSSPDLSQRIVMTIYTGDLPPGPPESIKFDELPNYYWRSATYEQYTSRGWMNGDTQMTEYLAGDLAILPETMEKAEETIELIEAGDLPGYRLVRQEVSGALDLGGVMFFPGVFLTADSDYQILWRKGWPASPETAADSIWLERGDLFGIKVEANQYQVYSLLPQASEEELLLAGADYPAWIGEHYLALPVDLPRRVVSLAEEITAEGVNPYAKASAIEAYLREIPYSLDIPAPPAGRDVVDFFLFDLRQGYCDYYATAMVVMARSQGLPARLVIGYARGSYNPYSAQFIVSAADAHSWVEVYFPKIGWVEFEPTGGRPLIQRPQTVDQRSAASGPPENITGVQPSTAARLRSILEGFQSPLPLLVVFAVLALFSWNFWVKIDTWRLNRLSPALTLAQLFRRLTHHGRSLVFSPSGATPYEFSHTVSGRLEKLGQARLLGSIWKPAAIEVRQLIEIYALAAYSPRHPDWKEKWRAIRLWRNLRWRLWVARLMQRFKITK